MKRLASAFYTAKQKVIEMGYSTEIDWQDKVSFNNITEVDFLREAAWVILSSGMREVIIRKKFPEISKSFFEWESSRTIVMFQDQCRNDALCIFNHSKKIEAIIQIAIHVFNKGFLSVRNEVQEKGINYLMQLPYMGPVTSYHFAKNIGLPVVKPDRHLTRIAKLLGYTSPYVMCSDISRLTDERIQVIDIVLWRFATLKTDYLKIFSSYL